MEFDKGKAYPTVEYDRIYVLGENYRLDIFDHGKTTCLLCKSDEIFKESSFDEGEPGYILRQVRCNVCRRSWHEVYAIAGCQLIG